MVLKIKGNYLRWLYPHQKGITIYKIVFRFIAYAGIYNEKPSFSIFDTMSFKKKK